MAISVKALSLSMAKKIADAAEARAIAKDLNIVIAIMDAHGICAQAGLDAIAIDL